MDFASRKCVPCEGGIPAMTAPEVDAALRAVDGWDAREERTRIHKHYRFKDFVTAMRFVDAMAALAEAEGHHPDFSVHYSAVDVTLWTHAVGGLSDNDFILAAKLDRLPEAREARP
jgi:4a-hydroxytetrahydrobiopterin dehydratase